MQRPASYEQMANAFSWALPARLNMAAQVCDDWADRAPDRTAIIDLTADRRDVSFAQLRRLSDALAHHLQHQGVQPGDRVGVLMSQSVWCAVAHIAIWKLAAVSVPLFKLFREEALTTRVRDAGLSIALTDEDGVQMLSALPEVVPLVPARMALEHRRFETAATRPEDPAILIYTSGTTGRAKGALHGHRVLSGHLPGVQMFAGFPDVRDDVFWTPADWAWIGGLFNVAMASLAMGCPVVAARMPKFSVEGCRAIVAEAAVTRVFFPPTVLRMIRAEGATISGLRAIGSGGEPLGAEMMDWGRQAFGLTINEFYGQTECNLVAASCADLFEPRPGCIGRQVPGHTVAVLDASGQPSSGEGDVAVRRGSASMMLCYWNRPEATQEKFSGDWMLTGDRGRWEGDYLRFVGREDDVITSAGYRIGPSEVEDCLLTHEAVATVGVVGKPDPLRTEIVKAYVVPAPGTVADAALAVDLQNHVKARLASYSYPREIEFLDALPMTVTGKVIRKELKARAAQDRQGALP
ncbi:MAG: AMP-binding protein [Pseudomonadota bacterium]